MKSCADPASSFCFPETMQVFSNPTPIIQSTINPQWSKNQSSVAETSASTLLCLIIVGGREGCQIAFFRNFYPLQLLIMTLISPDFKNCKEHLTTHLTFASLLHDFQPSILSVTFLVLHFY